jgi:hypothetical protein
MIHRTLNTKVDQSRSIVNGELSATDVVVNKSLTVTGSITARSVVTDTVLCDDALYAKSIYTTDMVLKSLTTTDLMTSHTKTSTLFVTKIPTDEYAVGFVGSSKVKATEMESGVQVCARTLRLNKGTFILSYSFSPSGEVTVSDYEVSVLLDETSLSTQRSSTAYSTDTSKNFIVSGSCVCVATSECVVRLVATVTFTGTLSVGNSELMSCRIV